MWGRGQHGTFNAIYQAELCLCSGHHGNGQRSTFLGDFSQRSGVAQGTGDHQMSTGSRWHQEERDWPCLIRVTCLTGWPMRRSVLFPPCAHQDRYHGRKWTQEMSTCPALGHPSCPIPNWLCQFAQPLEGTGLYGGNWALLTRPQATYC